MKMLRLSGNYLHTQNERFNTHARIIGHFCVFGRNKSQGMIFQTAFLMAPHKRYSSLPLLLKTIGNIAMM